MVFYKFDRNNNCSRLHFKFPRDNTSGYTVWLEYYENIIKWRQSQGTADNAFINEWNKQFVFLSNKKIYYHVKQMRFGFKIHSKLFFLTKKNSQQTLLGFSVEIQFWK